MHDRLTGSTERVNVSATGEQANGDSEVASISADGRHVAFWSEATNLVPGDTNAAADVFVHDRVAGTTTRVSISSLGEEGDATSYLPFNMADARCLSSDGRFVAFVSGASNLVPNDGSPWDVFVHDRDADEDGIFDETDPGARRTERIDQGMFKGPPFGMPGSQEPDGSSGQDGIAITPDGRYVAFTSRASNLVLDDDVWWTDVFLRDRQSVWTRRVSVASNGKEAWGNSVLPVVSADGRYVGCVTAAENLDAEDTNGMLDVYVHDTKTEQTVRVSVRSDGSSGSKDNSGGFGCSMSDDGRFVAFESRAVFEHGDTCCDDVYLHDRDADQDGIFDEPGAIRTTRASKDAAGGQPDGGSFSPSMSGDGRFLAFSSYASDLVGGDTNGAIDVFLLDRCGDASWSNYGSGWPGTNGIPALTVSADPEICTALALEVGNASGMATSSVVFLGFTSVAWSTAWDGTLLAWPSFGLPMSVPAAGQSIGLVLPCDHALCGLQVFLQQLQIDPNASKGISFSDGLQLVVGT
ncbi:MAG: hypothetical protein U1E76_03725 [Planctomycetota bacterium]